MQTDKPVTSKAETEETKKQFLLTRKNCPVCGGPSSGCVCHTCLEDMSGLEPEVVNRFIHTLASRDSRQKQRRPEWLLNITETETDI